MDFEQGDVTNRYPHEPMEDFSDYSEALDELLASRKDGSPHIPTFAQRMLERLKEVGLLHRPDIVVPINARKVKLHKGQEVWIRFDTCRDYDEGYMAVEVMDAPRSDMAILAAMTAWLGQPIDFEQILEATWFVISGAYATEMKRIGRIGASLRKTRTTQDPIVAALHGHMLKIRLDLGRFLVTMGRTEENRDLDGIIFPRTEGKQDITPENVGLVWEESA